MASFVVAPIMLVFASIICETNAIGTVLHHPKSRLVPVSVEVSFTCTIRGGVNPHWVIGDRAIASEASVGRIANEGYMIDKQDKGDDTLLILTFNATMDKNGTIIHCSSLYTHSNTAVLLILNESPLLRNPSIMNPNASSVLLKWSPPFLWPGTSIDHYSVSITGPGKNSTSYYVNATFSDAVATFTKVSDNPAEIRRCNKMLFSISAVTDNGIEMMSFTIIGGYLPNATNITPSDVNITILFESDRSPLIIIDIELPTTICSYQYLNYTITIESGSKVLHEGPYQQYGSHPITRTIASRLDEDVEYTLMITIVTLAGVSYSKRHLFNTSLQLPDQAEYTYATCHTSVSSLSTHNNIVDTFFYKVMLGVFVTTTMILLLIFIVCLCALYQIRKKKRHVAGVINSTNRAFNAMTTNPIYDGPIYDSIVQSQFNTLPTKTLETSTNGSITLSTPSDSYLGTATCETNDHSESAVPDRYVKQSRSSFKSATSVSTKSGSVTGLEGGDNKQKKLSLTLPTYRECTESHGNIRGNQRPESDAFVSLIFKEQRSKNDEDNNYTVMSPIDTITTPLNDGGDGMDMEYHAALMTP